ncbi:MAG: peptidoglycan editing factor PgeF [Mariprofundaceae bacterium]
MLGKLFVRSSLMQKHGINALFTQRNGGVSSSPFDSLNFGNDLGDSDQNIQENLLRLYDKSGFSQFPHRAHQMHQTDVLWCEGEGSLHKNKADVLLTKSTGCAVAVRTADCLPVLLGDPITKVVAAVHAGWRGTVAAVVKVAVQEMCLAGAKVENIVASLGPCIGVCCFEVSEEVAERFKMSCFEGSKYIHYAPTPHIDLAGINQYQLLESGVKQENIEIFKHCTCCHPDRFYSYRRESGVTGRQLAVVAMATAD